MDFLEVGTASTQSNTLAIIEREERSHKLSQCNWRDLIGCESPQASFTSDSYLPMQQMFYCGILYNDVVYSNSISMIYLLYSLAVV